jgi:hypothetical protein
MKSHHLETCPNPRSVHLTGTASIFDRRLWGRGYSFAGRPVVDDWKGMMDEFITHTSWMRYVADDASVMALSIPGTYTKGKIGFWTCR